MAAFLDESNGQVSLAFLAGTPIWHNTGNEITLEDQAQEAEEQVKIWIAKAGLPLLKTAPVLWLPEGAETLEAYQDRKVIYRPDTVTALSTMGAGYKVHQPQDMFEAFWRICDAAGLAMETAGVLGGSKKTWAQGASGLAMNIGNEKFVSRIVLAGSCDGSMASVAKAIKTCIVCSNTFQAAFGEDGKAVKQYHRAEFSEDAMLAGVLDLLDKEEAEAEHFEKEMNELFAEPMDLVRAEDFFFDLLRPRTEEQKAEDFEAVKRGETIKSPRGLDTIMECYKHAPGASPKTAFGLVQAATYYIDNERNQDNPDARLNSALFGQGVQFKQQAFAAARELIAA